MWLHKEDASGKFQIRTFGFRPCHDHHTGRESGLRAQWAVFDNQTFDWRNVKEMGGAKIGFWIGFASAYVVARNRDEAWFKQTSRAYNRVYDDAI